MTDSKFWRMLYRKSWDEVTDFLTDESISLNEKKNCVESLTENGESTLLWATKVAPLELIKRLLEIGDSEILLRSDVNGMTPLHSACLYSTSEVIKTIVDVGGKDLVVKKDIDGWTALHIACRYPDSLRSSISLLIQVGEKPLVKKRDKYGNTALHLLCEARNPPKDIIEHMVAVGGRHLLSKRNHQNRLALDNLLANTELSDYVKENIIPCLKVQGEMIVVSDLIPMNNPLEENKCNITSTEISPELELLEMKETIKEQNHLIEQLKFQNESLKRECQALKNQQEHRMFQQNNYIQNSDGEVNQNRGTSDIEISSSTSWKESHTEEIEMSHNYTSQVAEENKHLLQLLKAQHEEIMLTIQKLEALAILRK